MSPKLPTVTAREVVQVAQKIGFAFLRQRGSHAVYVRSGDRSRIVIPMHGNRDLKPKTLAGIIADMGITIDEFVKLL